MIEYKNRIIFMDPENKPLPDNIIENAKKAADLNPTGAVSSPMTEARPVEFSAKNTKRGLLGQIGKLLAVIGLGAAAPVAAYETGRILAKAAVKDQDNQDKVNQEYSDKLNTTDIKAQIKNDANSPKR